MNTRVKAPELSAATDWLNVSQPLSIEMLRGKIVVLDFWTFCCVDCMHILPYLKELEHKYSDILVVIGVHSAKFPNEKDSSQIRKAIARYDIEHPVANDARFALWESYWIREWPTLVLIDPDGYMVEQIPCSKSPYGKLDESIEALILEFEIAGKLDRNAPSFSWGSDRVPAKLPGATDSVELLSYPGKVTADDNFLYISDTGHNRIVQTKHDGEIVAIIGNGVRGRADGDYDTASFSSPQGLAVRDGFLYVADTENHLLRKIDLQNRKVETIAGTGQQALLTKQPLQGGPASTTALSSPWDLTWVGDRLYICMAGPHQIWYYDPLTQQIGIFAGNAFESLKDGPLLQANLAQPSGITTDGTTIYFADAETSAVRKADIAGPSPSVTTLTGKGLFEFGDLDGDALSAKLQHPLGVAWHQNKLYVCDSYNHKIKIIDTGNGAVQTLSGGPGPGLTDGSEPKFAEPGGLTALNGFLYIADTNNNAVRIVDASNGRTSTLRIAGGKTASNGTKPMERFLPNCTLIEMTDVAEISANKPVTIKFQIGLPEGFHLNADAPLTLAAGCNLFQSGEAIGGPVPREPLQLTTSVINPGTGILEATAEIYYCGDQAGSACLVASFKWTCPVRASASSKLSSVTLVASIDTDEHITAGSENAALSSF
jgi:thiol-disulfide isomerase/thioredoxin/DNA-binding beta-propeller fold protein YncE